MGIQNYQKSKKNFHYDNIFVKGNYYFPILKVKNWSKKVPSSIYFISKNGSLQTVCRPYLPIFQCLGRGDLKMLKTTKGHSKALYGH